MGGYAKTKAEATQAVLDAAAQGQDVVVVHPSGILGPYDQAGNHIVQLVKDYMRGKLPACVRGGYDFVDVRDVAQGCLLAAEKGKAGSCYILSNRHYEAKDILAMVRDVQGGRKLPVLPLWMARAAAPLFTAWARLTKRRPLFTKYSLHTLGTNDRFSHDKATAEPLTCPGICATPWRTRWHGSRAAREAREKARVKRGRLRPAKARDDGLMVFSERVMIPAKPGILCYQRASPASDENRACPFQAVTVLLPHLIPSNDFGVIAAAKAFVLGVKEPPGLRVDDQLSEILNDGVIRLIDHFGFSFCG